MIVVLSGEGQTDLGACSNAQGICSAADFSPGPMCVLLDQLLIEPLGYSLRETTPDVFHFISETALVERARMRKRNPRAFLAPGAKRERETGHFAANAWDLGAAAKEMEANGEIAIAVLFRDNDTTRSSAPTTWRIKWDSVLTGFQRAAFERGVPMLPNPKSEAWLMCAAKAQPFQHCAALEDLPGNDDAPNPIKDRLAAALGGHKSAQELCDWLAEHPFEITGACEMPSFAAFYRQLQDAARSAIQRRPG